MLYDDIICSYHVIVVSARQHQLALGDAYSMFIDTNSMNSFLRWGFRQSTSCIRSLDGDKCLLAAKIGYWYCDYILNGICRKQITIDICNIMDAQYECCKISKYLVDVYGNPYIYICISQSTSHILYLHSLYSTPSVCLWNDISE